MHAGGALTRNHTAPTSADGEMQMSLEYALLQIGHVVFKIQDSRTIQNKEYIRMHNTSTAPTTR